MRDLIFLVLGFCLGCAASGIFVATTSKCKKVQVHKKDALAAQGLVEKKNIKSKEMNKELCEKVSKMRDESEKKKTEKKNVSGNAYFERKREQKYMKGNI